MELTYGDMRRFEKKLKRNGKMLRAILAGQQVSLQNQSLVLLELNHLKLQGAQLMATVQELVQNMDDLEVIAQQYLDLIIAKDAANAALQAEIAALVAQVAAGQLALADLQAGIDTAVARSQATEDALRAGLPGVPPVGGTPLNLSFIDEASFSAAVAAYTGPEAVTLDGTEVRPGTAPSLDYFSHSADGSVSTSGPTD